LCCLKIIENELKVTSFLYNNKSIKALNYVKQKAEEMNKTPTYKDIFPNMGTRIRDYFGSWNNLIRLLNLEEFNPIRPVNVTNEEIIEHIKEKIDELQRKPKVSELNYSRSLIKTRFGNYGNALKLAGYTKNFN
jgi:hypothetical protein